VKAFVALAALVALVGANCGGTAEETPARDVTVTTETAGKPAPPIEGTTLEGERLALADLRGRPVFVNVWASW
jgi:cytochrome c biogenesis protein CcmG/thiol:disulfide interchange protein DsbE